MKKYFDSVHEKKPFKCEICEHRSSRKDQMKQHVQSVHEENKPFKCNICDATFSEKGNMKKHVSKIHEGKKL